MCKPKLKTFVRRILITLFFAFVNFFVLAGVKILSGVENWFIDTLAWVIPIALGYFFGYGHGTKFGKM